MSHTPEKGPFRQQLGDRLHCCADSSVPLQMHIDQAVLQTARDSEQQCREGHWVSPGSDQTNKMLREGTGSPFSPLPVSLLTFEL